MSAFLGNLNLGKDAKGKTDNEKVQDKPRQPKAEKKAKTQKAAVHEESRPAVIERTLDVPAPSRGNRKLVFTPSPHWYSAIPPLAQVDTPLVTPTASHLSTLNEKGAKLIQKDSELYQSSSASTGHSTSDSHFLQTILSKGTLSDRLSALTLLVQASPVHNTKALETLKSMAERGRGKGGREEGLKAMRCVADWWVGGGAPGRKLRYELVSWISGLFVNQTEIQVLS